MADQITGNNVILQLNNGTELTGALWLISVEDLQSYYEPATEEDVILLYHKNATKKVCKQIYSAK